MKKKLWVSYAWADNSSGQVDLLISRLGTHLEVGIDRTNLIPGQHLWEQIAEQVTQREHSDAFAVVVSSASLASKACAEEIAYALDRTLKERGLAYPIIGLLQADVRAGHLPPVLSTRLCISLTDPYWVEKCVAAVHRVAPGSLGAPPSDFLERPHRVNGANYMELTPRLFPVPHLDIVVPAGEENRLSIVGVGPPGKVPAATIQLHSIERTSATFRDQSPAICIRWNGELSPARSLYVYVSSPSPTRLAIGSNGKALTVERISNTPGGGAGVSL